MATGDKGGAVAPLSENAAPMQPKKKPRGFKMKKGMDKKTNAVVVEFDDGSSDELPVGVI